MEGYCVHVATDRNGPENVLLALSKANFQNNISTSLCNILPPIGVFWDIENCGVPRGKSACALVTCIRKRFFQKHREAEFLCVCDINKEHKIIINELNDAQITVVHVDATSKNAADEKLKQCMRRFVDIHKYPATLILISDDINFATDLSDFRHRHHIHVILLHRSKAPDPLIACANEHYDFSDVVADLPCRTPTKALESKPAELLVTDLPIKPSYRIKKILKRLSDNCGGKVMRVSNKEAVLCFSTQEAAERAQKRMDNTVIYGQKVRVNLLSGQSRENSRCPSKESNGACEPSSSSGHESSQSDYCEHEGNVGIEKKFCFPPPPVLNEYNSPVMLKMNKMPNFFASKCMPPHQDNGTHQDNLNHEDKSIPSSNGTILQRVNSPMYMLQEGMSRQGNSRAKNIGKVSYMKENGSAVWQQSNELKRLETLPVIGRNINTQVESSVRNSKYLGYSNVAQGINNLEIGSHHLGKKSPILPFASSSNSMQFDLQHISPVSCPEFSEPVELIISNLDQGIDINEMKNILQSMFRECVWVLHISMYLQPDGNRKAVVKVPSMNEARLAISRFHRQQVGHKRILISLATNNKGLPFSVLKSEVVTLLKDVPTKQLPLFKFRELYEQRYHRAISVSELYKMWDAVQVHEDSTGRMVCLKPDFRDVVSPVESESSQELVTLEKPYCERHFQTPELQGWADQENVYPMPDVCMSLKFLAPAVHTLLDSHQGSLPLNSFCACYEADIGLLPIVRPPDEESSTNEVGIPVEHLITCVAGVEITKSPLGVKKIQWCENKANAQGAALRCVSPPLVAMLASFGREVVELLKSQPRCMVPFSKFIPIYHHHFGRQCRVADYGFTKLVDLLEALPHIIQVLGQGQNRMVTLTHRAQVRRFSGDLLRILKSRASKQILLSEFASAYEQCMEKIFDVTNYCICNIEDMLSEMPETTILVSKTNNEIVLSIPKRDQTPEEIERTKVFSSEVVELLKHTPTCSMGFNKFIPSYHHHFGKQCRVADYGFSKLIELFEVIPIIEIRGSGEDKILDLVEEVRNKVLSDRMINVLKSKGNPILLSKLGSEYAKMYGYHLKPSDFNAIDLADLLKKLQSSLKVVDSSSGPLVAFMDADYISKLSSSVRRILMEQPSGKLPIGEVNSICQKHCGYNIDLQSFQKELADYVKVESGEVSLSPLHLLARDMLTLLYENHGQMLFTNFESAFEKRFGVQLQPLKFGVFSLNALIYTLSEYFVIKGRKNRRTIQVNMQFSGSPFLTLSKQNLNPESRPLAKKASSTLDHDILNEPVPSDITHRTLMPLKNEDDDLMSFDIPSGKEDKMPPGLAGSPFASGFLHGSRHGIPTSMEYMTAFNATSCPRYSSNHVPYSTHPYHHASTASSSQYVHSLTFPTIPSNQQTFQDALYKQSVLESFYSTRHCFVDSVRDNKGNKDVRNELSSTSPVETVLKHAAVTLTGSPANSDPLMLKPARRSSRIAAQFSNLLCHQNH